MSISLAFAANMDIIKLLYVIQMHWLIPDAMRCIIL